MPRSLLVAFLLAAPAVAGEPDSPALKAPTVTFRGPTPQHPAVFEVTNPNSVPLPYAGYTSDSFDGLKKGEIAPRYRIELLQGKEWKAHDLGWCGTGKGPVTISAGGTATFSVILPGGGWEAIRVGVTWFDSPARKKSAVAWSEPVGRKVFAGKP